MTEEQTKQMVEYTEQLKDLMKIVSVELKDKVMSPEFDKEPFAKRLELLAYAQETYNKLFETLRAATILYEETKEEVQADVGN